MNRPERHTPIPCSISRWRPRTACPRRRVPAPGFLGTAGLARLTPREIEIVRLVGRGHTNREVAAQLFLSAKTVRNYLSSAFLKLGVSRRAEIVALAHRTGLVATYYTGTPKAG